MRTKEPHCLFIHYVQRVQVHSFIVQFEPNYDNVILGIFNNDYKIGKEKSHK